jgi:hypothetical protein
MAQSDIENSSRNPNSDLTKALHGAGNLKPQGAKQTGQESQNNPKTTDKK